ncbi:MAG: oxidoreductase [Methanomicrobiales archaeon]|nr:oxidoreductase [Methanomicrobiales archaeon]
MDTECGNPVWPCAMAGAAACLSGFDGLGVILHGSSGCYYFTRSLVQAPLYCTYLGGEEAIFGTEERLRATINALKGRYEMIAVLLMCVPSIIGEDCRETLPCSDVIWVDVPGYAGQLEEGYASALEALAPRVGEGVSGVNIDGIAGTDRFSRGNAREAERLLRKAGLSVATRFCDTTLHAAYHAGAVTVETNPDIQSGVGTSAGSLLGLENLKATMRHLESCCSTADIDPVLREIEATEEAVVRACDRFLQHNDPPATAIFSTASYAHFMAGLLATYLDADIVAVGTRNEPGFPMAFGRRAASLDTIGAMIEESSPALLIGSSYEHALAPGIPFVGMTYPLRGQYMLQHRALAGTEGVLGIMEAVLNAAGGRSCHRI